MIHYADDDYELGGFLHFYVSFFFFWLFLLLWFLGCTGHWVGLAGAAAVASGTTLFHVLIDTQFFHLVEQYFSTVYIHGMRIL